MKPAATSIERRFGAASGTSQREALSGFSAASSRGSSSPSARSCLAPSSLERGASADAPAASMGSAFAKAERSANDARSTPIIHFVSLEQLIASPPFIYLFTYPDKKAPSACLWPSSSHRRKPDQSGSSPSRP